MIKETLLNLSIEQKNEKWIMERKPIYDFIDSKREYWDKLCDEYSGNEKELYGGCYYAVMYVAIYTLAKNRYEYWDKEFCCVIERDTDYYNLDKWRNAEADVCNLVQAILEFVEVDSRGPRDY